jgi:predicted PurR-regulated permease PerM
MGDDRSSAGPSDEIALREIAPLTVRGLSLSVVVGVAALLVLREAAAVVVPALISLLLAYTLAPAVDGLTRWHVPRAAAAAIVYILLAVAAAIAWRGARDRIDSFLEDLSPTIAAVKQTFESGGDDDRSANPIDRLREAARAIDRARAATAPAPPAGVARVTIVRHPIDVRTYLTTVTHGLLGTTIDLIVIGVLTFLMLTTGDLYKRKLINLAGPAKADRRAVLELVQQIDRQIERYLLARLLISVIVAIATGVSIYWLGVSHALAWGLIAGALNVLPFVGPTAAVVMIATAGFIQFQTVAMAAAAGGAALVVAALEGNVITPLLLSRAGELNTVAVFVSVLVWGWVWDIWGLLLAVPIMVGVKAAADHIEPLKPIGELLGRE